MSVTSSVCAHAHEHRAFAYQLHKLDALIVAAAPALLYALGKGSMLIGGRLALSTAFFIVSVMLRGLTEV
eukprot:COSAG01_NODE_38997_length_482_cov_1.088773_1_plen_69_part_10